MAISIQHRENKNRGLFYIDKEGTKISEITYHIKDDQNIIIDHSETKKGYEHQGYASQLLDYLVDWARNQGVKIEPLCPFAEVKFDENPEYSDVRA